MWMLTVTLRCQVNISRSQWLIWRVYISQENSRWLCLTKATNLETDGVSEDSVIDDTTEEYWAGSGSGPDEDDNSHNETREALTHEASDHDAVSHASSIALRIYLLRFVIDIVCAQRVSSRSAISLFRYLFMRKCVLLPCFIFPAYKNDDILEKIEK